MSNISFNIKQILSKAKGKKSQQSMVKSCFSEEEQKRITKIHPHEKKIIIFVDSPAALYEYNLRRQQIKERLKEKTLLFNEVVFKIGN